MSLGRLPHGNRPLGESNLGESISGALHLGENSSGSLHPVGQALELCGISHWAARKVQTLSSGQRQRVMLARAVAQDTPILLLDEPTNFLDVEATDEVFQLLSHLAQQGKIIIVATHQRDWAQCHAHQVLWL